MDEALLILYIDLGLVDIYVVAEPDKLVEDKSIDLYSFLKDDDGVRGLVVILGSPLKHNMLSVCVGRVYIYCLDALGRCQGIEPYRLYFTKREVKP